MAGEDRTVTVTDSTREQPSGEQEKDRARDQTGHGETERDAQPGSDARPPPPLPPRPLPPSHQEYSKRQPLSQPPAVRFAPLPASNPPGPELPVVKFERPHYPAWHRAKLVLGALSLMVSAVILGVGLTLGLYNAQYYVSDYPHPVDVEFGTSATAAALAVVVTTGEFLKISLSSRRRGMHPGALVAFHLFVWLTVLVSVIITGILVTDGGVQYDYPRADRVAMRMQSATYEQVLLGFDCVLLLIHFILFVGSCVETNRLERVRKTVIVTVPVPVGAPYPAYPVYGQAQVYAAAPGAAAGQHPLPTMSNVPPQHGQGGSVAPPQQAVWYGGYYAPAPTGSQQQTGPVLLHGYYAPTPVPGATNSAQPPRREGSAGPGTSGSHRSRVQSPSAAQDTTSQQAAQDVPKPAESGPEK